MSWDPYIDLETGVLRNRLGITDAAELAQAESELTSYRLIELRRTDLSGRYDLAHLQAFHRYIFGDRYDWAGELRSAPSPRTCSAGSPGLVISGVLSERPSLTASPRCWPM